ncbi:MAG TPA: hypothetical protein VHP31_04015 [Caproicibacter sp.]|nr:hypothetical protein [Caproicibacter sp.]
MNNLISEISDILFSIGIPYETGVFHEPLPPEYAVITPLSDTFEYFLDDAPQSETQEARLSLFSKDSYIARKNQLVEAFLDAGFTITDRHYAGYENDTKYHNYAIDVAKLYYFEED